MIDILIDVAGLIVLIGLAFLYKDNYKENN